MNLRTITGRATNSAFKKSTAKVAKEVTEEAASEVSEKVTQSATNTIKDVVEEAIDSTADVETAAEVLKKKGNPVFRFAKKHPAIAASIATGSAATLVYGVSEMGEDDDW